MSDYFGHMTRKTSISILKAHLSRYLDAVKGGEEIIVTERGRPIARLSCVRGDPSADGRTAQLVREGRLRAPSEELSRDFWERPRPADPTGRSTDLLLDERREGR